MNKPGLVNGGLAGLFWSLVWTHVGQLFIVLSLAEIASLAPSSRGQFHYVSECGPVAWQSWLSYFSGWLSTIAWQSTVAVDSIAIGGIIDALIAINNPTYDPARWVTTGLTILTILLVAAFNTFAAGHLSFAEGVFMTCHVFAFVPICVTLWVMVWPKTSPAQVFAHFRDYTGSWPSTGLSVLVGQGANVFATSRCDAVANLAEEVEDAGAIIPQGMVWAFLLNIPLTFIMLLTYTFNFGPVDEAIRTPYPFIHIFHDALRSASATMAFTIVVLILLIMITISTFAATSRQTFAFA